MVMWNSTHRIRLTCTLKQNDHPGGSESVLHFGTPLYELIFIKNDFMASCSLEHEFIKEYNKS